MVVGKPTDGPISIYFNRRISNRISSFIVRKGISLTPNQISLITFSIALLSGILLPIWPILGAVLVELASVVDGVDGEVARLRGETTKRGGFLDAVLDRIADLAILSGLAVLVLPGEGVVSIVISCLGIGGSLLVSYLHARAQCDLGMHPAIASPTGAIAGRDVRLFAVFVGVLLGLYLETMAFIAILSLSYVSFNLAYLFLLSSKNTH